MALSYQTDDSDSDVPLHHRRPFGTGFKRKRVEFVRAQSSSESAERPGPAGIADRYLDVVLPKKADQTAAREERRRVQCPVCALPRGWPRDAESGRDDRDDCAPGPGSETDAAHEASLVHQICVPHSQPPSALDRARKGFVYLESHGWDPDAGVGLGPGGHGIVAPLKARPRPHALGLGFRVPERRAASTGGVTGTSRQKTGEKKKLDAGACVRLAREDRRRMERLQEMFYGNGQLERYLGRQGS